MTENEIETYLLQLENVNLALSDVNCGNRDELNQLRDDLLELISMSQNIGEEDESLNDDEMAENDDSSSDTSTDSEEFGVGSKCRAPFSRFSNSSINLTYHNALIFELDSERNIDLTESKVKVMFCNPLTKSMQPCPYFLKGTCNFENSCRFSHGESVPVSQLRDYKEPDFENVAKDTLCLVKQEDNLWKLGRITAVSREEESAAVSMLDTNEEIQAPFSTLLPISDKDKESPVSSSNLDDDVEEDGPFGDSVIRKQIRHHAWRCDTLGGWEKHTKGVASKLMVKMGFIPGQGLGKDNDGRLEPIEAKVLPKGKSLDKCLEKSSKDPLKIIKDKKRKEKLKERKRIKKGLEKTDFPSTSNSNVFDIINDKLNGSSLKLDKSVPAGIVSEKFSETNDKDLNIKLLRLQENIRAEERNSCRYKNGVERNEKCDKFASARVKTKLNESDNRLEELKKREKILLNEIANRKNHKKFVQF